MQCLGLVGVDLPIREHDLRARGEERTEFLPSPAGTARSLGERSENGPLGLPAFHHYRVVDVERIVWRRRFLQTPLLTANRSVLNSC